MCSSWWPCPSLRTWSTRSGSLRRSAMVSSSPRVLPQQQRRQSRLQARRPLRCYRRGTGQSSWPTSSPRRSGDRQAVSNAPLVWCGRGASSAGAGESHPFAHPVKLGEIVAHRQFTASGQINPFRIKEEPGSRMLLRDDGLFDRAPRHVPEPQKLQTFLDFLDSVKYGLMFARWGPELSIEAWIGWFSNLVRDHPQKYPQLRELYLRSSWALCMELRQGVPVRYRLQDCGVSGQRGRGASTLPPSRLQGKGGKGELKGRLKTTQSEADSDPRKRPGPYRTGTARLQVLRLQVKVSSRGRPSVACSPQVIASSGRLASSRMGRSSHPTTRPTSHSRQPCTLWPRDSSERPRRQGRHPFFPVGGQPKQLLSLVP